MLAISTAIRDSVMMLRSLRSKITLWFLVVVAAFAISAAAGFARLSRYIRAQAEGEMNQKIEHVMSMLEFTNELYYNLVNSSMKVMILLGEQDGAPRVEEAESDGIPRLYLGKTMVNGDVKLVDEVQKLMGGTSTILVRNGNDFIRISTNVTDATGKRGINTKLDPKSGPYASLIAGGCYIGIVEILGKPYYTAYQPIFNSSREVIGAYYVGYSVQTLETLRNSIQGFSVLDQGFFALLDSSGKIVLRTTEDSAHIYDEAAISEAVFNHSFMDPDWFTEAKLYKRWNYTVLGGLHLTDVLSLTWKFTFQILLVAALVLLMVLVVSYWLASKLSQSIEVAKRAEAKALEARDATEAANQTLEKTQHRLDRELDEAARYVRSSLPEPLAEPLAVDWCYVPSTELAGDAFGYHWIDDEHFAIYLLDVCGHGVGAALLSVTAINVIRSGVLYGTDFRDPAAVLGALNKAFPMERHGGMYFTVWYGVYHTPTRLLRHASGGHPPAFLLPPDGNQGGIEEVRSRGMIIGLMPDTTYTADTVRIAPGSSLIVFCDGAYEIIKSDGTLLDFEEFKDFVAKNGRSSDAFEKLLAWLHSFNGPGPLEDDLSLVRIAFPAS